MKKQREQLPAEYSMVVAEIDGRFYPLRTEMNTQEGCILDSCIPQFRWDIEDNLSIPPAIGPRRRTGIVSYPRYQDAIDFCHRRHEQTAVIIDAEKLAAGCEVYPERNAWFRDEIEKLVGRRPHSWGCYEAIAYVKTPDGTSYEAYAPTIDEALVSLYEVIAECESYVSAK